jgi:hypothetical protein
MNMGPAKGASAAAASKPPASSIAKAIARVSTRSNKGGNSLSLTSPSQPKVGNASSPAKESVENSKASDEEMYDAADGSNDVEDEESSDYEGDYLDDLLEEGDSSTVPFYYVLLVRCTRSTST